MKEAEECLPSCSLYAKYIQIAMIRFNIKSDTVRDYFGLYTIKEWNELFN